VGLKLNGTHQILAYAEDVNLLEDDTETINENKRESLIDGSKEVGLEINLLFFHPPFGLPSSFFRSEFSTDMQYPFISLYAHGMPCPSQVPQLHLVKISRVEEQQKCILIS
jgi:hypothetical protein